MLMKQSNITSSFLWLLLVILLCSVTIDSSSYSVHTLLVLANIYSYIRCILIWRSKGNSLLSLYTFFVLYMCASNLGQSIVSIIPYVKDELSIYETFSIQEIISSLRFQLLCVAFMGLGTSLYIDRHECNYSSQLLNENYSKTFRSDFPRQTVLKVVFIVAFLLVFIDAFSYLSMRQTMGYMDAYTERQLDGIPLYMQLANWLVILLAFYFAYTKRYPKLIIFLFLLLVCVFLICGNRSLTIKYLSFLLIVSPIVYPQYFKRKYWFFWGALLICFLALLSLISTARNDIGFVMELSGEEESLADMIIASLSEMGGSAKTVLYTMQAISKGFPHHLTQLYFMITAVTSSALCNIFGLEDQFLSLGEWVGSYAGIFHYGLGYSCVAEWFMNYGWFGCLFAGLYSYIITMFECVSYKNIMKGRYLVPAVLLTFLATQIFYARSSMFYALFDVRFGFWLIVVYKLIQYRKSYDSKSC